MANVRERWKIISVGGSEHEETEVGGNRVRSMKKIVAS